MGCLFRRPLAAILFTSLAHAQLGAQGTGPPLSLTLSSQSTRPGDIVLVDVPGTIDAGPLAGTVFGRPIAFDYVPDRGVWEGLAGVDLDAKPGNYRMRVETADGRSLTHSVRVLPRIFAVRHLTVPADFVNPPPEALARIARDGQVTEAIFARVTPRRWAGSFLLPVDGKPTSNFGARSYYNGRRRAPHAGIDFLAESGTPIRASNRGIVALAEPLYFTGNTVIVDHGGGVYSLFAHLSEFDVKEGDPVGPGTIVGLVGATGRVTGPHLHWSIRLQGARVDPLSLVAATR